MPLHPQPVELKIVRAETAEEFETGVNALLAKGWTLQGELLQNAFQSSYAQVMVRIALRPLELPEPPRVMGASMGPQILHG